MFLLAIATVMAEAVNIRLVIQHRFESTPNVQFSKTVPA